MPRTRLRRRRRDAAHSGFSMLELVIAMGILAFGMLGIAAAQIQAMKQGTRGRQTSSATAIAQQQYEQILRMPYSGAALQPTAGYVAVPWINPGAPLNPGDVATTVTQNDDSTWTEQVYNVTYRILADPSVPSNPDLRLLDLRITWSPEVGPNKNLDFAGILVNNDY